MQQLCPTYADHQCYAQDSSHKKIVSLLFIPRDEEFDPIGHL